MDETKNENIETKRRVKPLHCSIDPGAIDHSADEKPNRKLKWRSLSHASRLLSAAETGSFLPENSILRLRRLYSKFRGGSLSMNEEITDEMLMKIPFKIVIVPDKRDHFNFPEVPIIHEEIHAARTSADSSLSEEDRLRIIQEMLQNSSQRNVFEEIRLANRIPFQLPRNNQTQKNVANRIIELTGSDTVMLNDPLYMKQICQLLAEKRQRELERRFQRLAFAAKRAK